jgi:hypothetical protein
VEHVVGAERRLTRNTRATRGVGGGKGPTIRRFSSNAAASGTIQAPVFRARGPSCSPIGPAARHGEGDVAPARSASAIAFACPRRRACRAAGDRQPSEARAHRRATLRLGGRDVAVAEEVGGKNCRPCQKTNSRAPLRCRAARAPPRGVRIAQRPAERADEAFGEGRHG